MKKNHKDQPLYMISIAAKLTGMHPQTLRIYERKNLVKPGRTAKSTRLYSENDIEQLLYIQALTQEEGVNLAGVKIIMKMRRQLDKLDRTASELEDKLNRRRRLKDEINQVQQRHHHEIVWVPRREIVKVIKSGYG